MPLACNAHGCPNLIDRTALYGRCPEHARQYDQARGTAQERGYDARWARFSKLWRKRFPLCGMRADRQLHADHSQCVQAGLMTPAECVDHLISMRNGGAQYEESNLQSLCNRCNSRKRITHDGAFGR
jgi:5-methylcytosine-specific restriction enzyme A